MNTTHERDLQMTAPEASIIRASNEKPLCSVKIAAARIERSASTVYRMRRKPGPVRFVVEGRRIYVETHTLDEYLARRGSSVAVRGTQPIAQASTQLDPKGPTGADTVHEDPNAEAEHMQANLSQPGTSCGQRELIMPPMRSCFVVFYTF
jgi:hypothetical protein